MTKYDISFWFPICSSKWISIEFVVDVYTCLLRFPPRHTVTVSPVAFSFIVAYTIQGPLVCELSVFSSSKLCGSKHNFIISWIRQIQIWFSKSFKSFRLTLPFLQSTILTQNLPFQYQYNSRSTLWEITIEGLRVNQIVYFLLVWWFCHWVFMQLLDLNSYTT